MQEFFATVTNPFHCKCYSFIFSSQLRVNVNLTLLAKATPTTMIKIFEDVIN